MSFIVEHRHPPHNTIEHTHDMILVSTLKWQVSRDNTYGEVVNHQCNLTRILK